VGGRGDQIGADGNHERGGPYQVADIGIEWVEMRVTWTELGRSNTRNDSHSTEGGISSDGLYKKASVHQERKKGSIKVVENATKNVPGKLGRPLGVKATSAMNSIKKEHKEMRAQLKMGVEHSPEMEAYLQKKLGFSGGET